MRELLHSKLFRRNLKKWLFMYVGVMCLLTCVITYSKYISEMHSSSDARAASFNVVAKFDGVCANNEELCDMGSNFRPTEDLGYYFTVDTTGLEVSTLLVTNIIVDKNFTIKNIYDVTDGTEKEFTNYDINENTVSITENLSVNNMYVRKYKVVCQYSNSDDTGYKITASYNDVVKIGYSALQQD